VDLCSIFRKKNSFTNVLNILIISHKEFILLLSSS
jgi:hypothetical protein